MLLLLTLVNQGGQAHTFGCFAFAFEEAFERAKRLLSHTDQLLEARRIEAKEQRMLPVDLFDEYNVSKSARAPGEPW
ncbi:hypothetical protein [Spirosoma aerophilum]